MPETDSIENLNVPRCREQCVPEQIFKLRYRFLKDSVVLVATDAETVGLVLLE